MNFDPSGPSQISRCLNWATYVETGAHGSWKMKTHTDGIREISQIRDGGCNLSYKVARSFGHPATLLQVMSGALGYLFRDGIPWKPAEPGSS